MWMALIMGGSVFIAIFWVFLLIFLRFLKSAFFYLQKKHFFFGYADFITNFLFFEKKGLVLLFFNILLVKLFIFNEN